MSTSAESILARFTKELDALVEQVKTDRSVLAAILCGSLSHDTVWAKSDIDLLLVTVDDRKIEEAALSLYAGGLNVHACLMPRTAFRKTVEGALHNSFMHSLIAKGRLLYTHDETIAALFAGLHDMGERDLGVQLLGAATAALPPLYKAHKWFLTRGDLDYTALWILYAATPLARIEVLSARQLADREVIPQALKLNPAFFKTIYADLLNTRKSAKNVRAALDAIDDYLAARAPVLFRPVLDYLREIAEARSATEIDTHFQRTWNIHGITTACEYLADQALIGKASTPVQLTRRSNVMVQELAFVHREEPAHGKQAR